MTTPTPTDLARFIAQTTTSRKSTRLAQALLTKYNITPKQDPKP